MIAVMFLEKSEFKMIYIVKCTKAFREICFPFSCLEACRCRTMVWQLSRESSFRELDLETVQLHARLQYRTLFFPRRCWKLNHCVYCRAGRGWTFLVLLSVPLQLWWNWASDWTLVTPLHLSDHNNMETQSVHFHSVVSVCWLWSYLGY